MWKKGLSALGIIGILIVASIGSQIGKEVGKAAMKPSQHEVEAKLAGGFATAANQLNQRLPMMIDQDTRLDKVAVGPGPRAVYHHTFINYTSRDIGASWLQTNLQPEVMRNVCASAEMKKSLQYGSIYVYSYSGSDGVEIARFEIDRNDCGFPKVSP